MIPTALASGESFRRAQNNAIVITNGIPSLIGLFIFSLGTPVEMSEGKKHDSGGRRRKLG